MALLIAAVGGGVMVAIAGVARVTQLRMNARRTRRSTASVPDEIYPRELPRHRDRRHVADHNRDVSAASGTFRAQAEQVACFRNAARHLAPGGRFVIELWIPGIRRFPRGQTAVPFHVGQHHVGFETYDMTTQQGTSHHYRLHRDIRRQQLPLYLASRVRPYGTARRHGSRTSCRGLER